MDRIQEENQWWIAGVEKKNRELELERRKDSVQRKSILPIVTCEEKEPSCKNG